MNRNRKQLRQIAISLCLAAGLAAGVAAQVDPPKPREAKPKPKPEARTPAPPPEYPREYPTDGVTIERSITVDPNVAVRLCVSEGTVKVNGWQRNELRVFVRNGRKFGFKILEKNHETGKANWLRLVNMPGGPRRAGQASECLAGDSIEIDVPMQASMNIEGRTTRTSIDSVRKASVKNIEGNISLRNITGGVTAVALQGDVAIENSGGAISLETTTGNILAFEVSPGQIGDLFRAKTNSGTISLNRLEHRQIDANTISGSVLFDGKFLSGGLYNFKTSNGSVRLLIPQESSCMITAFYGFGSFESDIPIEIHSITKTPRAQSLSAKLGDGDATVKVTTSSGSIGIRKREP